MTRQTIAITREGGKSVFMRQQLAQVVFFNRFAAQPNPPPYFMEWQAIVGIEQHLLNEKPKRAIGRDK